MHASLILLPAITYGLLTLIFSRKVSMREISEALIKGHLVIFTFIAIYTEILSAFHEIFFVPLLIGWLLFLFVCFVVAALLIYRRRQGFTFAVLRSVTPLTVILVVIIAFILISTFVTGIFYPPNDWDSMAYHMPRVVHWINNNDVSFYPTEITRQNYQMPLAEFAFMHIQVLSGNDSFASLVQWVSFLVLICLGILIAAELGLSNRQQHLSAIAIATLPIAIIEASGAENDLVVSSFVMLFALFMLRIRKNLSAENLFFAATALGLALLTKGNAFLFCAAIGTSLAVPVLVASWFDRTRFIKAIVALLLVVIVALLLNTGHFWRNYHLYGHPLSTEGEIYWNEDKSADTLVSNTLRNVALHLGTSSERINWYVYHAIQMILGSQLDNPKTTWVDTFFSVSNRSGNVIHMLIALFSVVLLPFLWVQRQHIRVIWYAIGVIFGVILWCWILKWQPWAVGLHMPLFAMASPLLVMTITSFIGGTRTYICYIILFCMVLYSLPFILVNPDRPLVSLLFNHKDRMELYFTGRSELLRDYKNAVNIVKTAGTRVVGLYIGHDDWEYPFWAIAQRTDKRGNAITFRHVGVSNVSRAINEDVLLPIYVIATHTRKIENWKHATKYALVYTSDNVNVYKKPENNINAYKRMRDIEIH